MGKGTKKIPTGYPGHTLPKLGLFRRRGLLWQQMTYISNPAINFFGSYELKKLHKLKKSTKSPKVDK
jgi:hypothetical protein